jgi:hypothetical protein
MPQMWRLRFDWKNAQDESQDLTFVSSEEDAIPQLNTAINQIVASGLGETLTIKATRQGELRGNPGAPG